LAETAFQALGMELVWQGSSSEEVARDAKTGRVVIQIDSRLCRNIKSDCIVGNPAKAKRQLNFVPEYTFEEIVSEMVQNDYYLLAQRLQ
ncbi:MAG: GDP-mannose 4,6-dehydratase, partial [Anaerovorax sp.]